eukprot:XP_003725792.1 PREDICTED: protein bowel [Strongylocentrotus purpuratus]
MDYKQAVEAAMVHGVEYNQPMNSRENGYILPADQQGGPPTAPLAAVPNIHNKMPSMPQAAYPEQREPEPNPHHQSTMDPHHQAAMDPNHQAAMDPNHQGTIDPSTAPGMEQPNPNLNTGMNSNPNVPMDSDPNLNSSMEGATEEKHLPEAGMEEGNMMAPYDGAEEDENDAPHNLFDTKSSNPILVRGSWQWMCNQCPKSYTSKSNLIAHLLDHCGIKPHMCLACGKSFKQVAHLNTHRVIHTGRRKHICPICGRGFNQRVHLKRHMVTHNINVACTCELCGRKFAFPSELQFHHKKVHRKRAGPPKKNSRSPSNDGDNLQHFNASATMHPMMASQGQMMGPGGGVKRQGRYANIPQGTQYMPTGRRRTKAMKAQAVAQMHAAYGKMPVGPGPGRGPSNDHIPISPGDHMPHGSSHMSPRNDRTPPRHPQMSPRNDRMSPRSDPNAQGDDQMYSKNDRTPPRGDHMPQRQDSVSSRSSAMSPGGHDHMRQPFSHGGSQSPRGSENGPHDDGLLPAELFQPELVHPDAGKAVLQPDAMETLRFHPARNRPGTQRFRNRAPNNQPQRKSVKKKGAPLKPELTCTECGRQFAFPFELRDHLARHRDVRPYVCTECGHQFFKEHHLKQHQLIHTGLKPFRCHICDRAFALKANMLRHAKLHVNNRQHKCQVCDKSFSQKQTLSNHMVVHKDEKPFSCNICGKKFSRKVNLDSHVYLHFGNKPFKCSICGSKYNNKGNLKRHVKNKHGLDADLQSDGEKEENENGENADESQQVDDDEGRVDLDSSGEVPGDVEADVSQVPSEGDGSTEEQVPPAPQPNFSETPQPLAAAAGQQPSYDSSNQEDYEEEPAQPVKHQQTYEQPPQPSSTQQHFNDHPRPVSQSSYEEPERPLSQRHYSEADEAPAPAPAQQDYVNPEHPRRQSYGDQEQTRTPESYGNSEYIRQPSYPSHERLAIPEAYRTPEHAHPQPPFPDHDQAINHRNYVGREPPRQPLVYTDHHRPTNLDSYVPRDPVGPVGGRDSYPPYHAQAAYPRHGYHHVERFKIEQGEAMAPQNPMQLMHSNMGLPM